VRVGAGDERRGLCERRIESVEASPQRAWQLQRGNGTAVLGQRDLEVRSAHVVAGSDGHRFVSAEPGNFASQARP